MNRVFAEGNRNELDTTDLGNMGADNSPIYNNIP